MELFVIIKNRKISSNFFSVIRLFFRKFGKIPRIDYNSHWISKFIFKNITNNYSYIFETSNEVLSLTFNVSQKQLKAPFIFKKIIFVM